MELKNMVSLVSRTGRHLQRYNFHGHRQVVGCIPYRYKSVNGKSAVDEDAIEVLLISSQRKGKGMLFPKGGWEEDESIKDAALRETVEEAGVLGDVGSELGKWCFQSNNNGNCYEGRMFPLLVKEQLEFWPEKDVRQRIWISVREARKVCHYWWMKEALEKLVSRLTSHGQGVVEAKTESCSREEGSLTHSSKVLKVF
ncbi:nudix hydrolase 18, mitochondrial-like [Olea europaea subsp. europaea]|uniref:Nudix hydrolase 18, mitochondrial-like n=1 Tax=Olea europaea subsp. europaea TaxID=158383 RepID=A0A8S0R4I7_OLEEU|nr:nudix hydrolase 18, mitochondrial-like [Olea europaea subsp. europaea]